MATVKKLFDIKGMHCESCATGIQMALSMQDGISNASIDWGSESGEVEFDDAKMTTEQIQKAVASLGCIITPK